MEITQEEIVTLMKDRGLTIEKVIDVIIDKNDIIGVGLISLGQTIYLYTILNPQLRRKGITREEAEKIVEDYKESHYNKSQN